MEKCRNGDKWERVWPGKRAWNPNGCNLRLPGTKLFRFGSHGFSSAHCAILQCSRRVQCDTQKQE